ncbi:multidrug efflux SMR transporter [Neobacillus sp. SuZ13]|uniref:DMT family transporter n=1 Tax=Neobacillus sp. SuZ13 TaxID=3047875 RepID=UPI0024BF8764|nr:multidrug efflux SMR transporter [Neobacillus sp. SuZ13]WHY69550.1 multidrug efflux SMR transporter [Neobacillus sp. SuZ13]
MSWFYLILGICAEIIGTTSMKLSQGFTKLFPSIAIFVFYGLSLSLVTLSLKKIDISVAYAIWSGIGTATIAMVGLFFFKEHISLLKVGSIILIILGVVGLNIADNTHEAMDNTKFKDEAISRLLNK